MPARQIPHRVWLGHKERICNMYLKEKRSLAYIVDYLRANDLTVTKDQLEYRLRQWKVRQKVPKGCSPQVWLRIHRIITQRKLQGKPDSEVKINGQRYSPERVERETRRYRDMANDSTALGAQSMVDIDIVVSTPSPPSPAFSLPSLLPGDASTCSKHTSQKETGVTDKLDELSQNVSTTASLFDQHSYPVSDGSPFPMIEPTEWSFASSPQNFPFGLSLFSHSTNSLSEATMPDEGDFTFYPMDFFPQPLDLVATLELGNAPLHVRQELDALTREVLLAESILSDAERETIFQATLRFISSKDEVFLRNSEEVRGAARVVQHLLRFGQPVRNPIRLATGLALPLQIACHKRCFGLQSILLGHGADANLVPQNDGSISAWSEPAVVLAIRAAVDHEDSSPIAQLLASTEWQTNSTTASRKGFISDWDVFTEVAEHPCGGLAVAIIEKMSRSIPLPTLLRKLTANVPISAAYTGNTDLLRLLSSLRVNLKRENRFGYTPLHAAASQGHLETCRYLLSGPRETGWADPGPSHVASPLFLACTHGWFDIMVLLLEHQANMDREIITVGGFRTETCPLSHGLCQSLAWQMATPLHGALGRYLLEPVGSPRDTGLLSIIQYLLSRHAQVSSNAMIIVLHQVGFGSIPSRSRRTLEDMEPVLAQLVKAGTGVNLRDNQGRTALSYLLESVSWSMSQPAFSRPLPDQRLRASKRLVHLLLDHGALPSHQDTTEAYMIGDSTLLERVLGRYLCKVHGQKTWGHEQSMCLEDASRPTLLELAIYHDNTKQVERLLHHGAFGYSPGALCAAVWQASRRHDPYYLLRMLLNYRQMNQRSLACSELESTAIGIAAAYGNLAVLDCLLKALPLGMMVRIPPGGGSVRQRLDYMQQSIAHGRTPRLPFWYEFCEKDFVINTALRSGKVVLESFLKRGYKFVWSSIPYLLRDPQLRPELEYITVLDRLDRSRGNPRDLVNDLIRGGQTDDLTAFCARFTEVAQLEGCQGAMGSPISTAIVHNRWDMVKILSQWGFRVNAPAAQDAQGFTALQVAVKFDRTHIAKKLIKMGVDVDASGGQGGHTALQMAAAGGNPRVVRMLLNAGVRTDGTFRQAYLRAIELARGRYPQIVAMLEIFDQRARKQRQNTG